MAIHCQCRPVITDKIVHATVEVFALEHGARPSVGQIAKRLATNHGKPKCQGCTCKLAGNIDNVMARLAIDDASALEAAE